jgi:hypothetical protein
VEVATLSIGVSVTELLALKDTLFVGTSDGMVFSFPLQRSSKQCSISDLLVRATEISFARSTMQHPSFAVRKQDGVHRRVNCLARQGRFVFAGHEGNCISVWSYSSSLMDTAQPAFVKEYTCKNPVLRLEVTPASVFALTRGDASVGEVGLLLLLLNISALQTSADFSASHKPPTHDRHAVVTFTANPSASHFATLEAGLAEISAQVGTLAQTTRLVLDAHMASGDGLHQRAVASILDHMDQVQGMLRRIHNSNSSTDS